MKRDQGFTHVLLYLGISLPTSQLLCDYDFESIKQGNKGLVPTQAFQYE